MDATTAPRKMSNDYMNHLNHMLTQCGFGPQQQGVTVDWDKLDETLRNHYLDVLTREDGNEGAPRTILPLTKEQAKAGIDRGGKLA